MGNCLVTKLNGVVDNDNLERLGYMLVGAYLTGSEHFYMKFKKQSTVYCLDGTFKATGTRQATYGVNSTLYSGNDITPDDPNATAVTLEVPKYNSNWEYCRLVNARPDNNTIDASFLQWLDDASDVSLMGNGFNPVTSIVKNFKIEYAKKIAFDGTVFRIEACTFEQPLNVTTLGENLADVVTSIFMPHTINCIGSLDSVGSRTGIVAILAPATPNVSLDLVNFVNNARNAGRPTGSVDIQYANSITLKANGTVITPTVQTHSELAWTADTITFQGNPIS